MACPSSYARQAGTCLGIVQRSPTPRVNVAAPASYRRMWTRDEGYLVHQNSVHELNQEEMPNGIELTLKL